MVTVHDVAKKAGVSIATVSRALNDRDRISAATRERVLSVARELGYQPNDLARGLVGMGTQTIALLLPDITNPFFPEVVKGVQTVADARGHLLLMCHNADDDQKAISDLVMLRRKKVDAIILVAGTLPGEGLAMAMPDIPTVVLDRQVPGLSTDLITVDHRLGARRAMEHLLERGHRRIAFLTGPSGIHSAEQRRQGWLDRLPGGLSKDPDPGLIVTADFTERGGYAAGHDLLSRGVEFTAVFAANDLSAIGLLAALTEAGLRVPTDVSLIGFDGLDLTAYTTPRITTVAQPMFDLGRRAAELALDRVPAHLHAAADGPHTLLLETNLLIRDSTGPARSDSSLTR